MIQILTPKQEKFVQGLVSGLSQRQAYKNAYNTKNMKNESIDTKASNLFKNVKVRSRYDELINEYKEKALWTREKAEKELLWMIEQSKKSILSEQFDDGYVRQGTSGAFMSALQELNKLNDLYPSTKNDIQLQGGIDIVIGDWTDDDGD